MNMQDARNLVDSRLGYPIEDRPNEHCRTLAAMLISERSFMWRDAPVNLLHSQRTITHAGLNQLIDWLEACPKLCEVQAKVIEMKPDDLFDGREDYWSEDAGQATIFETKEEAASYERSIEMCEEMHGDFAVFDAACLGYGNGYMVSFLHEGLDEEVYLRVNQ